MRFIRTAVVMLVLFQLVAVPVVTAETPRAKPEDVGISTERLQRIHNLIQGHIDAGSFSGAVTLIARNGKIAHLEAQGLMDIESKKPMAKDAMFRIMSMTKPVVGVATMMMLSLI